MDIKFWTYIYDIHRMPKQLSYGKKKQKVFAIILITNLLLNCAQKKKRKQVGWYMALETRRLYLRTSFYYIIQFSFLFNIQ